MKHQPPPPAVTSAAAPGADTPTFEELLADPEIAALLDFDPVPRRNKKEGGWSADMQRMFIARLARHGSPGKACDELGMYRSGIDKVAKCAGAESFRKAWDAAVALAERRRADRIAAGQASVAGLTLPYLDNRRAERPRADPDAPPAPGMVRNEHGEWEDQESINARAEDARDSISMKLQRCRRLYLRDIAGSPGKRAAFEMLTELPIDWDKATRLERQDDEPWRNPNFREPDILLTAENGWLGNMVHGPDKIAELQDTIDKFRKEEGLPPIDWSAEVEGSE